MKRTTKRYVSKPGKHGTLFKYKIKYTDPIDSGLGSETWHCFAYDPEHALELFYSGNDGFDALDVSRVEDRT